MRKQFIILSFLLPVTFALLALYIDLKFWFAFLVLVPLIALGYYDMNQKKHAINRIFPIIGHARYILEEIRPEINQYFIESNHDGRPFSREERSIVYQRAKNVLDTLPFGTQQDV